MVIDRDDHGLSIVGLPRSDMRDQNISETEIECDRNGIQWDITVTC